MAIQIVASTGLDIASINRLASLPPAGRISKNPIAWHIVTDDKWVLDIIKDGYKIQFLATPRTPQRAPNPPTDSAGKLVLDKEVEAMLQRGPSG